MGGRTARKRAGRPPTATATTAPHSGETTPIKPVRHR